MSLTINRDNNTIIFIGVLNRDTLMLYSPFKLLNDVSGSLLFDFAALESIDTAGLAWILQQLARAQDKGIVVKLCNVPQQLLSLADVTAVRALLPVSH